MLKNLILTAIYIFAFVFAANAQAKTPPAKETAPRPAKKTNQRPVAASKIEAFEKATVAQMAAQCVKLETEVGVIELEMFPESAPESVRSFLNLAAAGAFDGTTFNRVVPGFIIQGGDLFTRPKMSPELDKRARRNLLDEPNLIKHERGILSMARGGEPNSATTNFFILLSEAKHLDGTFAAFGRITKGMEIVEAISKMPVENEKPAKPVRLTRAAAAPCVVSPKP